MIVPDVNVLVAAHRVDNPHHEHVSRWLRELPLEETLGIPAAVLVGFVRIVTHPKVYPTPTPVPLALAFADRMRAHPAYMDLTTDTHHWRLMHRLCLEHQLIGNDVPDAHLAALALAHDAALATFDRGFARFTELTIITPR